MPAHTGHSSIGQKECSDGTFVSEIMWSANQIADLLAKKAAESVRICSSQRKWLLDRERQLQELLLFLGRLTCVANAFELPDGTVVRDSTAVKACHRLRKVVTTVREKAVHANLTCSSSGSVACCG